MDAPQTFFTQNEMTKLQNRDKVVFLFNGSAAPDNINVLRYIRLGEESGINKRYLTASRSPWYAIENRPPAPIWVSVFNRSGLRFIRNEANIYNLTTFHCVYPKVVGINVEVDVLFAYLITDVAKEMVTRYGFSEKLGPVNYSDSEEVFLGNSLTSTKSFSESTATTTSSFLTT